MTVRELDPANDLLAMPPALRTRLDEDGFVFLRGVLRRQAVLGVRRAILECCRAGGWLVPGSTLEDGTTDPARACVEPEPAFLAVYREVQKREAFHALAHDPALLDLAERLLGEPAFPHPNKIARLSFPGNVQHTTPPHQDFPFIQGAARDLHDVDPPGRRAAGAGRAPGQPRQPPGRRVRAPHRDGSGRHGHRPRRSARRLALDRLPGRGRPRVPQPHGPSRATEPDR